MIRPPGQAPVTSYSHPCHLVYTHPRFAQVLAGARAINRRLRASFGFLCALGGEFMLTTKACTELHAELHPDRSRRRSQSTVEVTPRGTKEPALLSLRTSFVFLSRPFASFVVPFVALFVVPFVVPFAVALTPFFCYAHISISASERGEYRR